MSEQEFYDMVKAFQTAFGYAVSDAPATMTAADRATHYRFIKESLGEFLAAGNVVDQASALANVIYLTTGAFGGLGVSPEPILKAVHAANMRKLWPDGKPRHRPSDGRLVKPDNWHGPEAEIRAEIERQAAARGDHA